MEKKYRRKAFLLIMLSPILAFFLAMFVGLFLAFVLRVEPDIEYYTISFDVSLKIWALFLLWEGMKKSKTESQEETQEETQVSESDDCDCLKIGSK